MAAQSFVDTHGVHSRTADDGTATLELDATEEHLNPAGTVHGGVLATLVDTAMGQAVRSRTDEADVPATSQLTVTYLRPAQPRDVTVTAPARPRGEPRTLPDAAVEHGGESLVHAVATLDLLPP